MIKRISLLFTSIVFVTMLAACSSTQSRSSHGLNFNVYNPQENSIFPVTSTLIIGPSEAILFDAQFQKNDAENLVKLIRESGKKLTTIYISHGDPDFYFGLDVLHDAFPEAKIVATPATVSKISKTMQGKKAYWGPILKENAPQELILPEVLETDTLNIDGKAIKIVGFAGHDPMHTFAWIPSESTVLGGVVLSENMHIWMADNKTMQSRNAWIKTLDIMQSLKPKKVIAGHYLDETQANLSIIEFTKSYIQAFERSNQQSDDAAALIASMMKKYSSLNEEGTLDFSAKVVKGDIQWPK